MTTQPEWSGAVQRELDGVNTRFAEFSTRLDKLLTLTEYQSDKRVVDIRFENLNEKVDDNEKDIEKLKEDVRQSFQQLRNEVFTALQAESEDRKKAMKEFIEAKKSQFRWLVSMVMIPIGIALVELLIPKK